MAAIQISVDPLPYTLKGQDSDRALPENGGSYGSTLSPPRGQRRPKRATPLRERAVAAGVSDKLRSTPPGLRALIAAGPKESSEVQDAKRKLHAMQRLNQQIVARAELQLPRNAAIKQQKNDQAADRRERQKSTTF